MGLKPLFRNLYRYRLNSSIIAVSLAMGFACINLIAIFLVRESNPDSFHKNGARIYVLQADDPFEEDMKISVVREGAAEYMKNNFLKVEDFCRLKNASPKGTRVGNQNFYGEVKAIAASSNFFGFFSYALLGNNPENVLETSQDIVISKALAQKYFGEGNPLGKKITLINHNTQEDLFVTGVFKKPLESTRLNFDLVKKIAPGDSQAYVLLTENSDVKQLEKRFLQDKDEIPIIHGGDPGPYYLNSLKDSYLNASYNSEVMNSRSTTDLYIALVIGLMILGVAVFNYLGLINSRLFQKTKEFSIRRINGCSRPHLVIGFMGEVLLLVVISILFSLALLVWSIPFFNDFAGTDITISYLFSIKNIMLLLGVPALLLVVTCLFVSWRVDDLRLNALKQATFRSGGKARIPAFNIIQLIISVILIVGSLIILKQMAYINNKDIGLDKRILEVKIPPQYKSRAGVFKSELEKQPSIEIVSAANASPVLEHYELLLEYDDHGTKKGYTPSSFVGDQNYTQALGIEIIEGEGFSSSARSNENKCIINESLAKLFNDRNLIGNGLPGHEELIVVGIARDFHSGSLKQLVEPAYISYGDSGHYLMVKPVPGQTARALEAIAETWNGLIPDYPLEMESIGDRFEWMHRENSNYVKLIGSCCAISIFLSMVGLFAISFHSSRIRAREIGIRKVNGAKISEIISMLNKDFMKWVGIAFAMAIPISWYTMNQWLEGFAYKTTLSWWVFALAGLTILVIALLTVSWQSFKAARTNPVEVLRDE